MTRSKVISGLLGSWAVIIVAGIIMGQYASTLAGGIGMLGAGLILTVAIAALLMDAWRTPLLGGIALTALTAALAGIASGEVTLLASGTLAMVVSGAATVICFELADRSTPTATADTGLSARTEELLSKMQEHAMLSDTAKRVLFRQRELDLLRRVIEDDIERGDYNAGLRLCDDMADLFGYREEAEAFRTRIHQSRHEDYELQLQAAVDQLDGFLTERNWPQAHAVAARIRRLFPDAHATSALDARIRRAEAEHKQQLEDAFLEAAGKEDVELAMQRLRQLDRYLSRDESGRLEAIAQDVVEKHRSNLGVQFKLAVNDHRWMDAARIGDTIIAEFPNSKMAEEVRSMIDVLRTRASQAAVAAQEAESG